MLGLSGLPQGLHVDVKDISQILKVGIFCTQ